MKNFPIDYIRQIIEQTLYEEHLKDKTLFGGSSQVSLLSFYEQLQQQEEVDRYVSVFRDLSEQQNRTGLIMNGVIVAPENPTITNLFKHTIIPLTFTCSFRVKLADRDNAIITLNNLIDKLKGRKQDIAEFTNGKLFKVGTIGNRSMSLQNGDFVSSGVQGALNNTIITNLLNGYVAQGFSLPSSYPQWFYTNKATMFRVIYKENADDTWHELSSVDDDINFVVYPPSFGPFYRNSVSMSFDSVRCDEPRTLNSDDYCTISLGGSATITVGNTQAPNQRISILLGNTLVQVGIKKDKIVASSSITSIDSQFYYYEPLDIPSSSSADTLANKLISNKFITNSHTGSLTISNQYTFVCDVVDHFIKQLFEYARYGIQADGTTITYVNGITPNMIYKVQEIWSSWGQVTIYEYNAKIVESIDIENTESDLLTITIPFQVQGANN